MIQCDKCHKEGSSIREYYFSYGTKSSPGPGKEPWFSPAGKDSTWICDRYVIRGQVLYWLIGVGLSLFIYYCGVISGGRAIFTGAATLLIIVLTIYIILEKQQMAEMVAISTKKKQLKAQNFAAITASQYQGMLLRRRIR